MTQLRMEKLSPSHAASWAEMVKSMPQQYEIGFARFGTTVDEVTASPQAAQNHLEFRLRHSLQRKAHFLPQMEFVALEKETIVGNLSLRLELNSFLATMGGHIGYSVHPEHRNKGVASFLLNSTVKDLPKFGLKRVLITANHDNLASLKVMEKAGAVYVDDFRTGKDHKKRVWISALETDSALFEYSGLKDALDWTKHYLSSEEAWQMGEREPYWPKWKTPWWQLCFLMELGLIHHIPTFILKRFSQSLDTHYQTFYLNSMEQCPTGCDPDLDFYCHCSLATAMNILWEGGLDPLEGRDWLKDWLEKESLEAGGYNCAEGNKNRSPSFASTAAMLELLNRLGAMGCGSWINPLQLKASQWLVERNFVNQKSTGKPASEDFLNPVFPRAYFYDPLRGKLACLEALAQSFQVEEDWAKLRNQLISDVLDQNNVLLNKDFEKSILQENTLFPSETKGTPLQRGPSLATPLLEAALSQKVALKILEAERGRVAMLLGELGG